jgi:ADP-ribosylglycohydrolase
MDKTRDRFEGCLYGQAVGDALGLGSEGLTKDGVEGYYPAGLEKYEQIIPDAHRCRWKQGAWTDDTDMMICIVHSLIDHEGKVDDSTIHDIAENFKAWAESPNCKGIGALVHNVLAIGDYLEYPEVVSKKFWELSRKDNAPNGGLMRTSVVGLLKHGITEAAEAICRLTHYDPRCVGSCVMVSEIIHSLVTDGTEISFDDIKAIGAKYDDRIVPFVELAKSSESIDALQLDEQNSMGYTLRTLSAALWCLFHASDFTEGLLAVVNEGGDADTNAAVSCAILGAKFGKSSIPTYYTEKLCNKNEYEEMVQKLAKALKY